MNGFPYDDIVDLPHYESVRRQKMSLHDRAAQFAPFAALRGHEELMAETSRRTTDWQELPDWHLAELSRKLAHLLSLPRPPVVSITYFCPDKYKSGGEFLSLDCRIVGIDESIQSLLLDNGMKIPLYYISDIV